MKCPACQKRQNFLSWILHPAPRRICDHCGASLRYAGLGWQVAGHAALGALFVFLWVVTGIPTSVLVACAVGTVLVTGVALPWWVGRYRVDDAPRRGGGKVFLWTVTIVITLVAFVYAYENRRGALALQSAMAELEERGESLDLTKIYASAPVQRENNVAAAPIIAGLFDAPPSSPLLSLATSRAIGAKQGQALEVIAKSLRPDFTGNETEAARIILDELTSSSPALSELQAALARPDIRWPLNYGDPNAPLPHIAPLHNAAKILDLRARASLAGADNEQAAADARSLFRISEVFAESPLLITQLLAASILGRAQSVIENGIGRGSWTPEQLGEWKNRLRSDNAAQLGRALRVERSTFANADWKDLNPWLGGDHEQERRAFQVFLLARPSGWADLDKAYYLQSMQKLIDQTTSSEADTTGAVGTPKDMGLLFRLQRSMALMSLPAIEPVYARLSAVEARSEKLRSACAERLRSSATH